MLCNWGKPGSARGHKSPLTLALSPLGGEGIDGKYPETYNLKYY
jgi:hypothetical protein